MKPIKIFLSHSFDTGTPCVGSCTDLAFGNKIKDILKNKIFTGDKYQIITCRSPRAGYINDKICEEIKGSQIVIGLFSCKYLDNQKNKHIPPPWIISECSYALGLSDKKKIYPIYEHGVDRDDLTFLTIDGFEAYPIKNRDNIDEAGLVSYFTPILKDISDMDTPYYKHLSILFCKFDKRLYPQGFSRVPVMPPAASFRCVAC